MKLVGREGAVIGAEFALDKPVIVIGRGAEADVAIPDGKISRRHAEIRLDEDRLSISDLGSTNGTFVNGVRIQGVYPLRVGDEIRVGHTVLSVQAGLARAGQPPMPIPAVSEPGEPPAAAPPGSKFVWALVGTGLLLLGLLGIGGWFIWRNVPSDRQSMAGHPIVTAGAPGSLHTASLTFVAIVQTPTASPTPAPGAALSPPATLRPPAPLRPTATNLPAQTTSGTPPPRQAPFTVSWSHGRYEGWADGRRMSSDLTIENISLPQISPPYQPYFIISDANGVMRVGELRDYSSPTNPLPTLFPGQQVMWTWFAIMSNQEWVRGSVFRYGGWSWAQEFNPDGSLSGPARVISDQQLIPFLPTQIPPEQLATIFPTLAPSFVPTRAP